MAEETGSRELSKPRDRKVSDVAESVNEMFMCMLNSSTRYTHKKTLTYAKDISCSVAALRAFGMTCMQKSHLRFAT